MFAIVLRLVFQIYLRTKMFKRNCHEPRARVAAEVVVAVRVAVITIMFAFLVAVRVVDMGERDLHQNLRPDCSM